MPTSDAETSDPVHRLHLARANDRQAFRALVTAYQPRVFSMALRLTGQRADSEELTQDVFVQLHAALGQIADPAHLERWLWRTTYHRSIDRLRQHDRQGQKLPLESLASAPEGRAPDSAADPMAASHLCQLLLQLQPDARAVMVLRYQEDLDPVDIAKVLDMPIYTVKSHLRRSLQWLRKQCEGDSHEY
ncbi:MAG: sigma-70 family RNA polymerase sigma factor [Pseudomonadota bacterium]